MKKYLYLNLVLLKLFNVTISQIWLYFSRKDIGYVWQNQLESQLKIKKLVDR